MKKMTFWVTDSDRRGRDKTERRQGGEDGTRAEGRAERLCPVGPLSPVLAGSLSDSFIDVEYNTSSSPSKRGRRLCEKRASYKNKNRAN